LDEQYLLHHQLKQQPNHSHNRPSLLPYTRNQDGASSMELQQAQDAIDRIQASQRATPQYSASYLGAYAIKQLKERGCFVAFSCPSPPRSTHDDDMENAQDCSLQPRSVLTLAQQEISWRAIQSIKLWLS
jgi:hypothetical protein